MSEQVQTIKEIIEILLNKLTVDGRIEVLETADGPQFVVRAQEGRLLIGENGKNLISFNHIVKKIISKKFDRTNSLPPFSIDVNDYQAKKMEELKNVARLNAQRVMYFKKEVVLKPMSSFERRVIHITLEDSPDITTESRGEDSRRQVVIKPYP